ncbi:MULTISPECIES: deoxyguanosinetriphosphate triphosphohydrolase family protein [unclassified Microbacterium]|uniref:deoxyguanosinetriphosphate triphosphohydrolase family protein n=1 Tax=unclassified Microbacterium TaxID=2609290 RepID=UPI0030105D5B
MIEDSPAATLKTLADGSVVDPDREESRHRRGEESPSGDRDFRTPAERDRGRLGYSEYLRRLAGVTQVVSPELASAQMHSRSSHTHKVAMIAREIADHIARSLPHNTRWREVVIKNGGLDIAACEAAGLAHDIGHPPFGHAGEDALDNYLVRHNVADGFEGNAQTFRTVTRLDRIKGTSEVGLNLTDVTLAAILKYPYAKKLPYANPDHRKFGAYLDDAPRLAQIRASVLDLQQGEEDPGRQTLEASIMDLADDVAYAIHDLEDFLAAGLIDVGLVKQDLSTSLGHAGITPELRKAADFSAADFTAKENSFAPPPVFVKSTGKHRDRYKPFFNDKDYAAALHDVDNFLQQLSDPDAQDYGMNLRLLLRGFVSDFFKAIDLDETPPYRDGPSVFLTSEAWHQMQVLKSITRHYLVSRPRMGSMQRAQTRTIEILMDGLADWICTEPKEHSLPPALLVIFALNQVAVPTNPHQLPHRDVLSPQHYRALADYVCTMSDSEALMRSQWLAGTEVPGSFRLALS